MMISQELNEELKAISEIDVPARRNYFAIKSVCLIANLLLDIREELSLIKEHLRCIRNDTERMRLRK